MRRPEFAELLKSIPRKPGVYLMKDVNGKMIYVGKAIVLRNRVRSYFHESANQIPKVSRLVDEIANIEFIVTDTELEALILECNLIKKHRPRFNVHLKDDKHYPYIKISMQDDFPRIYITRRMLRDGARYFGPFTSSRSVHRTLDLLRHIFPYITCKREITGHDERPCLNYHIHRCPGPCIGAISKEEYRAIVSQIALFLEGRQGQIVTDLRARMVQAAEDLEFERAAEMRDQIEAVERVIEQQRVVSASMNDQDVIAFARDAGQACVQVFFIRGGKLIGRDYFVLSGTQDTEPAEIMSSFLKQFYDEAASIPEELLLQTGTDELMIIEQWLRSRRGAKVSIRVPRRGKKKALVAMAAQNAAETLESLRIQWEADVNKHVAALSELQEYLELDRPPARIECCDISNIQGVDATGSLVVFVKGVARKSDYRRFRIRTVVGADDYAMMQEVLRRRFQRFKDARAEESDSKARRPQQANTWALLPDLLILDGGKGQLNAVLEVLREMELAEAVPVVALAKKHEEVFLPGRRVPVILPRDSQALYLVQRVRDEAHRFAVVYHRKVRAKSVTSSILEDIPGIGSKRRRALLKKFGSLEAIAEASLEDLAAVSGMTMKAAQNVKEYL
ncbi:MAG: excinuclease ABC subunit UvrC [Desulfobacterales bacterium]|nr:excinuclease ABC subunit UvrC [Desulfobacterales bacterium]